MLHVKPTDGMVKNIKKPKQTLKKLKPQTQTTQPN